MPRTVPSLRLCYKPRMLESHKTLPEVGDVVALTVTSNQDFGTFLDWGRPKDLFLPFSEQTRDIEEGDKVVVVIYVDNNQRSCASMRLEKYAEKPAGNLKPGQRVDLLIASETDLGFKAVIDGKYLGVLYRNEIFKPLRVGQHTTGYVRQVREDGKIDLALQATGIKDVESIGRKILTLLETRGGFLPVCDSTSPEVIYDLFGISKKKFKVTIGGLMKKDLIAISDDGITLKSTRLRSALSSGVRVERSI